MLSLMNQPNIDKLSHPQVVPSMAMPNPIAAPKPQPASASETPQLPSLHTPPQQVLNQPMGPMLQHPHTPPMQPGMAAGPMLIPQQFPVGHGTPMPYYPSQYVYYPPHHPQQMPPMVAGPPNPYMRGQPPMPNYYDFNASMAHLRRKSKQSTTWSPKEDKLLRELKEVQKLGWREISTFFQGRTPNACQFRWRRLVNGNSGTATPSQLKGGDTKKKGTQSINFLLN
ncbi:hypothetical protein DICA1_E11012 [Diutina catenulata]